MGTVLMIFSFLLTDNALLPSSFVSFFISIIEKKYLNENYVEFNLRMGTVLVIFSFF